LGVGAGSEDGTCCVKDISITGMEEQIRRLFKKYVEGVATDKEREVVEDFFAMMQEGGVSADSVQNNPLLKRRLDEKIYQQTVHKQSRLRRRVMLAAAASLLLLLSCTLVMYLGRPADMMNVVAKQGKRLKVVLPDSSVAYLNAGSSLSYSSDMGDDGVRTIQLAGEGYFEVKHDESRPFIVESGTLKTRVLGTRFVVSDYPGEMPSVVVRSGKVGVQGPGGVALTILEKDERVFFNNGLATVDTVDAQDFYSWKDGKIVFDHANLKQVINILNRRFAVHIELTAEYYDNCTITGSYYDNRIEDVLKSLDFIYGIKYSLGKNGTIYLKTNPC